MSKESLAHILANLNLSMVADELCRGTMFNDVDGESAREMRRRFHAVDISDKFLCGDKDQLIHLSTINSRSV